MRARAFLTLLFTVQLCVPAGARLAKHWTYSEMFEKADLVVIANVVSSKDTSERVTWTDFGPPLTLIGVTTEFESSLILKGAKDLKTFHVHHYRYQSSADEAAVSNTPFLVQVKPHASFLLFLIKEPSGTYAPVTGHVDPAILSMLDLKGAAD